MSPTIVSRDGKPVMVIGTPGGSRVGIGVLKPAVAFVADSSPDHLIRAEQHGPRDRDSERGIDAPAGRAA